MGFYWSTIANNNKSNSPCSQVIIWSLIQNMGEVQVGRVPWHGYKLMIANWRGLEVEDLYEIDPYVNSQYYEWGMKVV